MCRLQRDPLGKMQGLGASSNVEETQTEKASYGKVLHSPPT